MLALTTMVGSLVMAAGAWGISRAPGWSGLRWYSGVTLSGALYAACEFVVSTAPDDDLVLWAGRLTLASGCVFIFFWVPFGAVLEQRNQPLRIEPPLRMAALVLAALSCVPGVMTGQVVQEHAPGDLGILYREMVPTAWSFLPIAFFVASIAWYALRLAALSWRTRRRLHLGPMLALWTLVLATVHDTLVLEGFYSAPYLLVSAFLAVMLAIGVDIVRRFVRDAWELARISEELAETQALLVHRERLAAVGEVAAVVAHEVRNPLAVIFNVVSQLRHQLTPQHPGRELVEMAAEESERLALLVSELLDFTSPQPARPAPCDLQEVLQTAVNAALTSARMSSDQVHFERGLEDAGLIEVDEALVYRAVVNLVTNALQASGRDAPVRVRAERLNDQTVQIDVEDAGDGVPERIAEKIFEPFFTTRATGTGLGLSLARRAVEAQGGTLTLHSEQTQGACFRMFLPARQSKSGGLPEARQRSA